MAKPVCMSLLVGSALVFAYEYDPFTEMTHAYVTKPVQMDLNNNCRNRRYPRSEVGRYPVPKELVSWDVAWNEYNPLFYTASNVITDKLSDPRLPGLEFEPRYNEYDDGINRISFCGNYNVINSLPINPVGRTGLSGRGILPRWGPNHWVNLLVTKHRRDSYNNLILHRYTGNPILEFVGIRSTKKVAWSLPGRIVGAGESLENVAKLTYYTSVAYFDRRLMPEQRKEIKSRIDRFFENGIAVYQGYVDDQRNTDNAWVETTVLHYHDETGDFVGNVPMQNTDNIVIEWVRLSTKIRWIGRHFYFVANLTKRLLSGDLYKRINFNISTV